MKLLISISSVSFSYGEISVLEKVSFNIKKGDFIAIIGPNGSGKTTLLKLLLGLLSPTKGKIDLSPEVKIGYVPQRYMIDKNFPGTVKELLSSIPKKILKQVDIENLLPKKFVDLSGGQQQRVLIALALQQQPTVLMMDEPTAGVDVNTQQNFYVLLKKLNESGMTILLVTHEVGVVSALVKNVICINHKICCMGEPRDLPKMLQELYGPHFIHHHQHHHKGGHHA